MGVSSTRSWTKIAVAIILSAMLLLSYVPEVFAKTIVPRPKNVNAYSIGYSSVKISWTGSTTATHYQVYRASSKAGKYVTVGSKTKNKSLTNSSLTTGKTYFYKVKAYKKLSNGKYISSNFSLTDTAKPIPSRPINVSAARSGTRALKISWKKVNGATRYQVYRATSRTGTYSKVGSTTTSLSFTNTNLTAGKVYYYKVKAIRTSNGKYIYSNYSAVVSRSSASGPTAREAKAVEEAKSYLRVYWYSRASLIQELKGDGFTHAQAVYGVDNSGADWFDEAAGLAKLKLEDNYLSKARIIEILEDYGFTEREAVYGATNSGADWYDEAEGRAQVIIYYNPYIAYGDLVYQLVYIYGFTESEAEYAAVVVGVYY